MFTIRQQSKWFIVAIAMMAALPPFAIDTYTPAIHSMAAYFYTSQNNIIVSISTYFIGFGVGVFAWGAVSDCVGRKRVILLGMTIYIIASLVITHIHHIHALYWMRFFQALGDSAGVTVSITMLRDSFAGARLTKMLATVISVTMFAPLIAPLMGSVFISVWHWQAVFYFLAFYGCLVILMSLGLPETLEEERRLTLVQLMPSYVSHLMNRSFMWLTLSICLAFSATFSFIGASSYIYMTIYHLSKFAFSGLFAFNAVGIMFGGLCVRQLSYRVSLRQLQYTGLAIFSVSDLLMLIATHWFPGNWMAFTPFMFFATIGWCFLITSLMSNAMNEVDHAFGSATALVNLIRNMGGALFSYLMARWLLDTVTPLPLQQLCLGAVVLFILAVVLRDTKKIYHKAW